MLLYKTLKWKLNYPTPGEISRRLVNLTNAVMLDEFPAFVKKVDNFSDLCLSGNIIEIFYWKISSFVIFILLGDWKIFCVMEWPREKTFSVRMNEINQYFD